MVRDANLAIGTHTTVFVTTVAYSATITAINLGMSGLPLRPSTMLCVHVSDPAAVREITVEAQVSVDGGVTFKALGKVIIPANSKGQFSSNIGRELKLPYKDSGLATDVRVQAVVTAAADASVENATLEVDLCVGERSDPQQ